jgi:hypothetical protein
MGGNVKKFLMLLIILVLASTAVQATMVVNKFTNDFSVSSPYTDQVKICSCESRAETFTVENTGNFHATYHVDVLSEEADWYQLQLQDFTLAPGESRDILLYAHAPCGVVGEYFYSVRFVSSFGRERIITRDFEIKKCQNAFLTINNEHNASNVGQPITYQLHVKNVAEFADTFTIDLGAFDENAVFEHGDNTFYLQPNEEKWVNVTITPPPSVYGAIEFIFTISSEKNGVTEQKHTSIFIENLFDHEIVIETQAEYCSRVANELTFTVKNMIDIPNEYDVIITGPGFMNYDTKELSLDAYEEKDVTITLDPKKGQEGTYNIKIRINSKLGDIRKERSIDVDVFDCYAFDLGFVEQDQDETGAYVEKDCCGSHEYTFNIRNSGQTEETYNIIADAPVWFAVEETTIRLKPSENRNVKFRAQLPCTDETYEFPVTVQLTNRPEITETVLFTVESLTQRSCYAVEARPDTVNIDEEDSIVPFIISHAGIEAGVYDVTIDGELYTGSVEERITLEPGEEAVLHAETTGNLTDYFDGRYLGTLELTLVNEGISYREGFWTKFSHISPVTQFVRKVLRYNYGAIPSCIWMIFILAVILLITAIIFIRMLVKKLVRKPFTIVGTSIVRTILVVLAVAVLIALLATPFPAKASLYEETAEDDDGIVFEWYENEVYNVKLSDYFDDPDADWLEYIATQPNNIAVEIEGSKARLIPEHNWAGEELIVFTANDQRGGLADSPIITLRVLQRKELTVGQWLLRYCVHLNLLLLFLILLLLAILSFACLRSREQRHEELLPPKNPKGRSVYTVVNNKGQVEKLGGPIVTVASITPPEKKVVKKRVKKATAKKMTAAQKAALSKALDRALVSSEPHELKQVLRTHKKRETQENIAILRRALKNFKRNSHYRPNNRETFYRYLVEKKVLAKLENAKRKKIAVKKSVKKVAGAKKSLAKKSVKKAIVKKAVVRKAAVKTTPAKRRTTAVKAVPINDRIDVPQPEFVETAAPHTQVNIAVGSEGAKKEFVLVGAKNGSKVHNPQCIIAQRIPRENRVSFSSKTDAVKAGYGPCKVCQSFDEA